MTKHLNRRLAATLTLLTIAALAVCGLPGAALAAEAEVPGADYADLGEAIRAGETAISVTGSVSACDVPAGVTITVDSGGYVAGDFRNRGTVRGGSACGGTISNFGGTVSGGGNVINYTELASGASAVYDAALHAIAVTQYDGKAWIAGGQSPYYYVGADGYLRYYQSGDKVACSISYRYSNDKQTAMRLSNSAAYPSSYNVSFTQDVVIPAAPDKEIDYVFAGWACDALGYVEGVNAADALTVPAGTFGNITLISCWTYRNGHNEGLADGSTAMSAGGESGSGGASRTSGASGGLSGLAGLTTTGSADAEDESSDNTEGAVVNLLSGAQSGGARVRNASSVSRHSFTEADGDIEARVNAGKRKSVPWQWIGIASGGALLLFALGMTVRRRLRERDAATLEKLRIFDEDE